MKRAGERAARYFAWVVESARYSSRARREKKGSLRILTNGCCGVTRNSRLDNGRVVIFVEPKAATSFSLPPLRRALG